MRRNCRRISPAVFPRQAHKIKIVQNRSNRQKISCRSCFIVENDLAEYCSREMIPGIDLGSMKTMKFCLLLLLAAGFGPARRLAAAEDHARSSANLELARQLNQAFVEVADDVSPMVVVITVTQKAAPALKLPSE